MQYCGMLRKSHWKGTILCLQPGNSSLCGVWQVIFPEFLEKATRSEEKRVAKIVLARQKGSKEMKKPSMRPTDVAYRVGMIVSNWLKD